MTYFKYSVVGFPDKNRMATIHKEYKRKGNAMRLYNKLKETMQCVVLRREQGWDDCSVTVDGAILKYEDEKEYNLDKGVITV